MKINLKNTADSKTPLEILLNAIKEGDLTSGTRLVEVELAELLGVSRTPIREALRHLQSMGLAEPGPQRGLIVTRLDYEQLQQLYAVREGLEGMATRLAAQNATGGEIEILRTMVKDDKAILTDKIPDRSRRLSYRNRLLHTRIAMASHNAYMIEALHHLRIHLSLVPGSTYDVPERGPEAQLEHEIIVDAISARDADLAERVAREHIRNGYRCRLQLHSRNESLIS